MTTNELNDQELGVLMVALKYWRAHRQETPTRRSDPALTGETLDLLVAKLDGAIVSLLVTLGRWQEEPGSIDSPGG